MERMRTLAEQVLLALSILQSVAIAAFAQGTCPCTNPQTDLVHCGRWVLIQAANWPKDDQYCAPPAYPCFYPNVEAVHMILTYTGKVLIFGNRTDIGTPHHPHYWDPNLLQDTSLEQTRADTSLFCAGHAAMADGRIMIIGGHYVPVSEQGISRTTLFDPSTGLFSQKPNMSQPRWYPTASILPDGRMLAISGTQHEGLLANIPEIYNGNWTPLPASAKSDMSQYPFIHVDPYFNGTRVLYVGPGSNNNDTQYALQPVQSLSNLDLASPSWQDVTPVQDLRGHASVRYDRDKILKSGGTFVIGGSATNAARVLTMLPGGGVNISPTGNMQAARTEHQLTLLADGTVIATGGSSVEQGGGNPQCSFGVYVTEIWDPNQGALWCQVAPMSGFRSTDVPRMYHSTALLLPDGRVLSAGGECKRILVADEKCPSGDLFDWCTSADFYEPPYLFKAGAPGMPDVSILDSDRPGIAVNVPLSIVFGEGMSFGRTAGAGASTVDKVALVRPGAATHSNNMDQRYIPFLRNAGDFTEDPVGGTLSVPSTKMPDRRMAPPGYYMLFLVNNLGRPSKAPFVIFWEIIQSSVSGTLTYNGGGTWTFRVNWSTTAKVDQGDDLVLTRRSDGFQVTVSGTPTDATGLVHSLSITQPCVVNETWDWFVKSKRLKYTTGTTLSISSTTTKTFKTTVCLE
jgi:hypothetical protein